MNKQGPKALEDVFSTLVLKDHEKFLKISTWLRIRYIIICLAIGFTVLKKGAGGLEQGSLGRATRRNQLGSASKLRNEGSKPG